jgi:hypothetical protein
MLFLPPYPLSSVKVRESKWSDKIVLGEYCAFPPSCSIVTVLHSALPMKERVTILENNFHSTRIAIPKDIEERAEKLTAQLNTFKANFEHEKKRRKDRENGIAAELSIETEETKNRFEDERVIPRNRLCGT